VGTAAAATADRHRRRPAAQPIISGAALNGLLALEDWFFSWEEGLPAVTPFPFDEVLPSPFPPCPAVASPSVVTVGCATVLHIRSRTTERSRRGKRKNNTTARAGSGREPPHAAWRPTLPLEQSRAGAHRPVALGGRAAR
jgi:hypothetical protein